ncbi:MAG: phosphoethanolamine--lipid A transferase [Gemmobacter sp.]|nr:phosphoethanolamine--lipid A transferase [Gemmobacter sp.]
MSQETGKKIGFWRPELSGLTLNLIVATALMAGYNQTFWVRAYGIFGGDLRQTLAFGGAAWALTMVLISALGFRWLQKGVLVFLILVAAASSFYLETMGVLVNREMIQNMMTTTVAESRHLINAAYLGHMLIWGILPSALVLLVRVRRTSMVRAVVAWPVTVAASFALMVGLLYTDYRAFASVMREHHELLGSYQPGAPINGAVKYARMMIGTRDIVAQPLGRDATKGALLAEAKKPVLTVIFVGETARAQDFGLNGYVRDTTPELRTRGVINFPDVTACGTSTAVSVPCMFSVFPAASYSHERHLGSENLLDVLTHAGVTTDWWDNNTGHQGVAMRTPNKMMTADIDPAACSEGECTDAVFLAPLRAALASMTTDTVLVLHSIGSHGPAYHLRYPPEFARFSPACQSTDFAKCSPAEIVNAYDNTIVFTDHILSTIIDMLAAQDQVIPSMIYLSDHGESLGENGLYLHAAPGFIAPDVQTKVPMVMWVSDAFQRTMQLDAACLGAKAERPTSHDVLFHTVLGLMDVSTEVHDDALDLVAGCRISGQAELVQPAHRG